jgi:transposase-like protein
LRPLITAIPNHNFFTTGREPLCSHCGSTRLERRGYYRTKVRQYQRYQCKDCGSWSRTDTQDRDPRAI